MKLRTLISALLIAAAFVVYGIASASAAPALWVVQSSTGKLYLFGTVHLLREGIAWRSPELVAAMKESQDLYLEIADPENTAGVLTSLLKTGFDRDHPLSTKLSNADLNLLDEAARRYGFAGESALEPMQPWLVVMILSTMPEKNAGYKAANGVDALIRKEFVAAGKPVHGLETVDSQIHIFSDMPQAVQIALLESQLKEAEQQKGVANLDAIVNAWSSGDEEELGKLLHVQELAQNPIYAKIFTDRNKAWAAALAERLKQPGTSFISVGAGHLVGPEGVPALLQKMGFTVTRVQIAQVSPPPSPAATRASSPSAMSSPTASASATPIPPTITPPPGWSSHAALIFKGPFEIDREWAEPKNHSVVISGHLDLPGISPNDLGSLDALFHQGTRRSGR